MKLAVIGGSGFIGTRLVEKLLADGHQVRIIDKKCSAFYPDLWLEADVRDLKSLVTSCKDCEVIFNLAAEHRDDVSPRSLYDEVNVTGARNVCIAADELGIKQIIFTSSVAVYGFAPEGTSEDGRINYFNDYGRTKYEAELIYEEWCSRNVGSKLVIVRPTVVFGERNRGNVYNLLRQIATGAFVMVGSGRNSKSMAYVQNVVDALAFVLTIPLGSHTYNYVDKPDLNMNELVARVRRQMGIGTGIGIRLPYWLGFSGGLLFDFLALVLNRSFPISSIRVKKFCSTTSFSADEIRRVGFCPKLNLGEGIERTVRFEFLDTKEKNGVTFESE